MRKGIHPENYRLCVFKDMGTGDEFITKSCAETRDTVEKDGRNLSIDQNGNFGRLTPFLYR
ncbi:MAG: 50S ribosomal protein L31 [Owenweeksia sp.]|nr:50S ribosomal protein L31 [Owenweeksia sp.]